MNCPSCDKKIDIIAQFKDWIESYGEESGGNAIINFFCENCSQGGFWLNIESYDKTEDIESPQGLVKFPKLDNN